MRPSRPERPHRWPGRRRLPGSALRRAQRGDEAALTALYRTYQPQLGRYLRVCAPNVAEDLASEVWLAVASRIKSFQGEEAGFRAWLFTVARRRVIDHRRREGRRRTDPVDSGSFADLVGRADTEMAVMDSLGTEEALALVERVLTPEQAEVVMSAGRRRAVGRRGVRACRAPRGHGSRDAAPRVGAPGAAAPAPCRCP